MYFDNILNVVIKIKYIIPTIAYVSSGLKFLATIICPLAVNSLIVITVNIEETYIVTIK